MLAFEGILTDPGRALSIEGVTALTTLRGQALEIAAPTDLALRALQTIAARAQTRDEDGGGDRQKHQEEAAEEHHVTQVPVKFVNAGEHLTPPSATSELSLFGIQGQVTIRERKENHAVGHHGREGRELLPAGQVGPARLER